MRLTHFFGILALALALPGLAVAQEENKKTPQQEQAERRVQWILRSLERRLELSETQKEQVKKILMDSEMKQSKLREEQSGAIEKLLTPDQKQKYKELRDRQNRGRGGRGGRGGRRGGMGRMMGLDIEQIKERLGLTPEQVKKIEALIQEAMEKGREEMQKMRQGGGGFDFNKMRELMEKGRKEIRGKINALLNDEQKKKFAELNKEMDERMQRMMERFGMGRRGSRGQGRGRGERRPRTPEETTERRLKSVMDSLKLPKEEAAVLGELIKKVISYQSTTGAKRRTMRDEIRKLATGGGDEAAIKAKVDELRKLSAASDAKLKTLRDGLRELLTAQQEAVLISHGVLD